MLFSDGLRIIFKESERALGAAKALYVYDPFVDPCGEGALHPEDRLIMSHLFHLRRAFLTSSTALLGLVVSCGGQTTSGSSNAGKEAACSSLCSKA